MASYLHNNAGKRNEELPFNLVGMTEDELYAEIDAIDDCDSIPSDNESIDGNDLSDDELLVTNNNDDDPVLSDYDTDDDVPLAVFAKTKVQVAKRDPPAWSNISRPGSPEMFIAPSGVSKVVQEMADPTPYKLFQLFMTDDLVDHLVFQTNLYAQQDSISVGKQYKQTNQVEIKGFLGLNLLMGIKRLPSYKDYWSTCPALHDHYISSFMTQKRFGWILGNLHVNDNSLQPPRNHPNFDKLYKIRPFLETLSKNFSACLLPSKELAIDESMIKFKGRSTLKQYMPKKPIKRGYKVWVLADKCGYCLKFEIYTGKSSTGVVEKDLGARVVKHLTNDLHGKNHILYFDNYFASVQLMEDLKKQHLHACGTVNNNRMFLPKFKPDKNMERGECEWFTSNTGLAVFKWKDNRSVHMISNFHNPEETNEVNRKGKDGTIKKIACPQILKDYNANMNFVDKFDQYHASYKIDRRSRKWWHRIFFYFLDASVVNAYQLYKLLNLPTMTSKAFRISIVTGLLADTIVKEKHANRDGSTGVEIKKSKPYIPTEIRLESSAHQPTRSTRRRCAKCSSKKKPIRTDWICSVCKVPLCLTKNKTCFQDYHRN